MLTLILIKYMTNNFKYMANYDKLILTKYPIFCLNLKMYQVVYVI